MQRLAVGTLALLAAVCWVDLASAQHRAAPRRGQSAAARAYHAEEFAHPDPPQQSSRARTIAHWANQWEPAPSDSGGYVDEGYSSPEWVEGGYDESFDSGGFVGDVGFGDELPPGEGCDLPGCCHPLWFAETDVLLLQRSTAHDQTVTQTPVVFTIAGFQLIVNVPLQSTRSFDFNYEPGLKVNLGRYLGTDLLNRDHTLEFMYYGLQEWNASHQIASERIESILPDGQGGVVPVRFGRLFTPFPTNVGGWNRADLHQIQNFSTFNNFEVNYRIRWNQRQGRLVGWPDGTWTRECNPGRSPSILAGIRYISLNDQFRFFSSGPIENLDTDVTTPMSGHYDTGTSNDLIGGQVGGEFGYQWCKFGILARGKTGLFCNVTQQTTHLETQTDTTLFLAPSRDYHVRGNRLGFVGEFGFEGTWQILPSVALKLAYDFLWVQGVSLAPEQIEFSVDAPPRLIDSGYVCFQGVSAGCEVKW